MKYIVQIKEKPKFTLLNGKNVENPESVKTKRLEFCVSGFTSWDKSKSKRFVPFFVILIF